MQQFNQFNLEGKKIILTGASSGIGRQCAIDFSRMGATVVMIARNQERLSQTLLEMSGTGHIMVSADLTNFNDIPIIVESITQSVGKVDGLVNCAGISTTLPLKLVSSDKLDVFF